MLCMENVFYDNTVTFFVITFNPPLMSGGTKGHTYLNKPAAKSYRSVEVYTYNLLLPPGINGLIYVENSFSRSLFLINCL